MKKLLLLFLLIGGTSFGQTDTNAVHNVFSDLRIINAYSTETLEKNQLAFVISHRFGDMFGAQGGYQNFFGLDDVADIRIGLEYGILDNLMIGISRTKGPGPLRGVVDGYLKYRFLTQKKKGMPLSMALASSIDISTQKKSSDSTSVTSFPKWTHRISYNMHLILSRKFASWFSAQVMGTFTWRNYVNNNDQNAVFGIGAATRFRITKKFGIILEYIYTFRKDGLRPGKQDNLGIAFEFKTYGHNFQINFVNSRGLADTQYLTYNTSNWLKGEFRIGFTISRNFDL
jgi:hypothetical protein